MLPHQLSCPIGGLLLSVLMLKDANANHYPVPGVECVVSHEARQFTDDGHKVLLGHLLHPLRVGNTLVSAHCNVHSFTPPPKRRRGRRVPPNQLINVPSVKGYKGWRNFREPDTGEVRRIPLPRTWVNSSDDFAQLVRGALTPQLSREALNVIHAPRLRYLASFEAAEEHLTPRDPLACGFDAHEGSHVRR